MLDFSTIKNSVSIGDVLSAYGVNNLRSAGPESLVGPCPLHGGDNPTAFRIQLRRGLWHCFTRCGGGGTLDLVARLEGTSLYLAAAKLQQLAMQYHRPCVATLSNGNIVPGELAFRLTVRPHPYLNEVRGLSPATCERFGLGLCQQGILAGRIAIPIHDERGRLVAYAGRSVEPVRDKYRFPGGFPKGRVVFNAWRQEKATELIVVEGFFDVFHLDQNGYPHAVALMGCAASADQFQWLVSSGKPLALLLDGDDAGHRGQELLAHQLGRVGHPYREIHLQKGAQPEHLSRQDLLNVLA